MVTKKQLECDIKMLKEYKNMCIEYDEENSKKCEYESFLKQLSSPFSLTRDKRYLNAIDYFHKDKYWCDNIERAKKDINEMKKKIDERVSQITEFRKRRIDALERIQKLETILRFNDEYENRKMKYVKKYKNVDGYKEFCNNDYSIPLTAPNFVEKSDNKYIYRYNIRKEDDPGIGTWCKNPDLHFINQEKTTFEFLRKQASMPYNYT